MTLFSVFTLLGGLAFFIVLREGVAVVTAEIDTIPYNE